MTLHLQNLEDLIVLLLLLVLLRTIVETVENDPLVLMFGDRLKLGYRSDLRGLLALLLLLLRAVVEHVELFTTLPVRFRRLLLGGLTPLLLHIRRRRVQILLPGLS